MTYIASLNKPHVPESVSVNVKKEEAANLSETFKETHYSTTVWKTEKAVIWKQPVLRILKVYQTANKFDDITIIMYCTALICLRRCRRMRKVIVSFAYLSIRMEQLASRWAEFHEIDIWVFFRKSVEEIWVSLKFYKSNWYFTWRPTYIFDSISLNS